MRLRTNSISQPRLTGMAPKEKKDPEPGKSKKEDPEAHKEAAKDEATKKRYHLAYEVAYLILAVITIVLSIVIICYTLYAVVEILKVTTDRAGLIVALFVILVCAGVTAGTLAYSGYYVYKKAFGIAILASYLLLIPFIVQASLVGTVVNFTLHDEKDLFHSLAHLFSLSRGFQTKYAQQYHYVEYSLKCCGLYNPNDYRLVYFDQYHPPDVPISCCPAYHPALPDNQQEDARQVCLNDRTYYKEGCKVPAIDQVEHALDTLQKLNWPLLALDFVMMVLGLVALLFAKWRQPKNEEKTKKDKDKVTEP